MTTGMCRNHSHLAAVAKCKTCAIPICEECRIVHKDGTFCSDACYEKFADFAVQFAEKANIQRHRLPRIISKRGLMILAVVLAVVLGILVLFYGVRSPLDIPDGIARLIESVLNLF